MSENKGERLKPLANYPFVRELNGTLYLSGVSARQKDGTIAGTVRHADGTVTYDVVEQLRTIMANIGETLRSVGGGIEHVVDVTIFLTDIPAYFQAMNGEYNKWFGADGPTRTTVGAHQLPHPDMVIELKVVARKPA